MKFKDPQAMIEAAMQYVSDYGGPVFWADDPGWTHRLMAGALSVWEISREDLQNCPEEQAGLRREMSTHEGQKHLLSAINATPRGGYYPPSARTMWDRVGEL